MCCPSTKIFNWTSKREDNVAVYLTETLTTSHSPLLPPVVKQLQASEIPSSALPEYVSTRPHAKVVHQSRMKLQDYKERFCQTVFPEDVYQLPHTQIPGHALRRKKAQASLLNVKAPNSPHVHFSNSTIFEDNRKQEQRRETVRKEDGGNVRLDEGLQVSPDIQLRYFSHKKIVLKLREHIANLFGCFCIIDMQLPTNAVHVVSEDLLLEDDLAQDDINRLCSQSTDSPWILNKSLSNKGAAYSLTVHGNLFERHNRSGKVSHRFVGQMDLTTLLADIRSCTAQITAEPIQDMWLFLAHQHLAREGFCSSYPRKVFSIADTISEETLDDAIVDTIRLLHEHYLVIEPIRCYRENYVITHLAPSLISSSRLQHQNPPSSSLLDLKSLEQAFRKGEKFCARVLWKPSGLYQWLYCLPMYNPELNIWLCFMIDGRFPDIWAAS